MREISLATPAAAAEKDQGRVMIVANKVADTADETRLYDAFAGHEITMLPADPVVNTADRQGLSPIDVDPDSPAVSAVGQLGLALIP